MTSQLQTEPIAPTPYYDHGGVKIYCGDFMDILPALGRFDHMITDPPYEKEAHASNRRVANGNKPMSAPIAFPQITEDQRDTVGLLAGLMVSRWTIIFCQAEAVSKWISCVEAGGLKYKRTCVWIKPDAQPQLSGDRPAAGYESFIAAHQPGRSKWNGGGSSGVYVHTRDKNLGHQTQKPIKLMREIIRLFTDPGDTIVDPFCGSGTTIRAAKDLGRRAVGIDNNEKYCEIAPKRMAQDVLF